MRTKLYFIPLIILLMMAYLCYYYFSFIRISWDRFSKEIPYAERVISKTKKPDVLMKAISYPFARKMVIERISQLKSSKYLPIVLKTIKEEIRDKEKNGISILLIKKGLNIFTALKARSYIPEIKKLSKDKRVKPYISLTIYKLGDKSGMNTLISLLHSKDITTKLEACQLLSQLPEKKVVSEVRELLKSKTKSIKLAAIKTLLSISTYESIKSVIPLYKSKEKEIRFAVRNQLTEIGFQKNKSHLTKLLLSDDENLKTITLKLINDIKDNSSVEIILEIFPFMTKQTKDKSLFVLSNLASEKHIPKLKNALEKEKNKFFKKKLENLIKRIKPTEITKVSLLTPSVTQPSSTIKKYVYRGTIFRDPFLEPKTRKIGPIRYELPDIESLVPKGYWKDRKEVMILFESYLGNYVLRKGRLYDLKNNLVKGIRGEIKGNKVILIDDEGKQVEIDIKKLR